MQKISQQEFEVVIQNLIDGNTTKDKIQKELKTDIRTLNRKIREMSEKNPTLYEEYIKKF